MQPDTAVFLTALFARCDQGYVTFTAIHPDGQHPTPSRHVRVDDLPGITSTVACITQANRLGWGAFFGVALRNTKLGRWRRGGNGDLRALPALFVDVDDPSPDVLHRLQTTEPVPSCITSTGGGFHSYYFLSTPLTDFTQARFALHALADRFGGDKLSTSQCMRLPNSCNTKPQRCNALCRVIVLQPERQYALTDFGFDFPPPCNTLPRQPPRRFAPNLRMQYTLNPAVVDVVIQTLLGRGYRRSGAWLSGPCLFPQHHHQNDAHVSFGFNTETAYANCFRCGSLLLKDVCQALAIRPADYGGLLAPNH